MEDSDEERRTPLAIMQVRAGIVMGSLNYLKKQLILPYKISCMSGSLEIPLLSLRCVTYKVRLEG